MKKSFFFLVLYIGSCMAGGINSCDSKKMELQLTKTLKNIKKYKRKKNNQIMQLNNDIIAIKKELNRYKISKEHELKIVTKQLNTIKKKITSKNNKNNKMKKKLKHTEKQLFIKTEELNWQRKKYDRKNKVRISDEHLEVATNIAMEQAMHGALYASSVAQEWIEVVVENCIDIHELALKYYSNREEYLNIYAANKNVINSDLEIYNGMLLKIPMTENFREQPIMLNMD